MAISDVEQQIATPAKVLVARGTADADAAAVLTWARENEIRGFVVGMPFNMDGTLGPQAKVTERFVAALSVAAAPLPVLTWDERLSSFQADEWLASVGLRGGKGKKHSLRDALAATAILKSYLTARNANQTSDEP